MSHALTRRNVSAIAKLDFSDLGHAQRIEAIAKALGYASGAALMGTLKATQAEADDTPKPKYRAVMAFGSEISRRVEEFDDITDSYGDQVSGDLSIVEFDTQAELTAYMQGAADADGWMDFTTLASEEDEPNHPIFAAIDAEPDLVKAYNLARAAYWAEDDD